MRRKAGTAAAMRALLPILMIVGVAITLEPLPTVLSLLFIAASAALSSPRVAPYAIAVFAAYTPFETVILDQLPESVYMAARFAPQALMLGCFAGVLLRRVRAGKRVWVFTPIDLPLVCFLAASLLSFLVNRPPATAAVIAYQPFLRFIPIAFYLPLLIDFDSRDAARLTKLLFAVAGAVAAFGLAQSCMPEALNPVLTPHRGEYGDYIVGGFSQATAYDTGYQVFATLGRYNTCGVYLAFFFVLSLPFFLAYPQRRKVLCFLYALLLPCIYLTSARTAFLFVAVGATTLCALRKRWSYILAPAAGLALLTGVPALLGMRTRFVGYEEASTAQRLLEVFDPFYLTVAHQFGRLYFILSFPFELMSLGLRRALLGFGPGTLDWRSMETFGLTPLDALNVPPATARGISDVNWSYILGQSGCLGLAAVLWMCLRMGKAAFQLRLECPDRFVRCLSEGFIAVLTAHCAAAFFAPVWEWRATSLYIWLYAGLVVKFLPDRSRPEGLR